VPFFAGIAFFIFYQFPAANRAYKPYFIRCDHP